MSALREYIQLYCDALYWKRFGLVDGELPSLTEEVRNLLRELRAHGVRLSVPDTGVENQIAYSEFDGLYSRVVYSYLANSFLSSGTLDYLSPDSISAGSFEQKSVPSSQIEASDAPNISIQWREVAVPPGDSA